MLGYFDAGLIGALVAGYGQSFKPEDVHIFCHICKRLGNIERILIRLQLSRRSISGYIGTIFRSEILESIQLKVNTIKI